MKLEKKGAEHRKQDACLTLGEKDKRVIKCRKKAISSMAMAWRKKCNGQEMEKLRFYLALGSCDIFDLNWDH